MLDDLPARMPRVGGRDLAVLLLFGVVWLGMCFLAGVRPEALDAPHLVSEHLLLRFVSLVVANRSKLMNTIWLIVMLASFPMLAWLLSRRSFIAVGAGLATVAGWTVFLSVELWSMILEDPEPGATDGYYSVPFGGIIWGGMHIALAWGLLAGCRFAFARWRRRTAEVRR